MVLSPLRTTLRRATARPSRVALWRPDSAPDASLASRLARGLEAVSRWRLARGLEAVSRSLLHFVPYLGGRPVNVVRRHGGFSTPLFVFTSYHRLARCLALAQQRLRAPNSVIVRAASPFACAAALLIVFVVSRRRRARAQPTDTELVAVDSVAAAVLVTVQVVYCRMRVAQVWPAWVNLA